MEWKVKTKEAVGILRISLKKKNTVKNNEQKKKKKIAQREYTVSLVNVNLYVTKKRGSKRQ